MPPSQPAPVGQRVPQPPQLFGSLLLSTQLPAQQLPALPSGNRQSGGKIVSVTPAHGSASLQAPAEQAEPGPQTMPQPPQLLVSESCGWQTPLQQKPALSSKLQARSSSPGAQVDRAQPMSSRHWRPASAQFVGKGGRVVHSTWLYEPLADGNWQEP